MKNIPKYFVLFCFVLFLILSIKETSAYSVENNLSEEEQARTCLEKSRNIFEELQEERFSTNRINDILEEAESLFEAQKILKEKKRKYDFSLIFPYCESIVDIKEYAFRTRDEINALTRFYNEFLSTEINTESIDSIIFEINTEITNERYENVDELIDKCYEEISIVKSENTKLNLFYKNTTNGIKSFFIEKWLTIILTFGFLVVLFLIYQNTIRRWVILKKIRILKEKKVILNELIQKTQKDYFEKGSMSENNYLIKNKKFAELIRDINRQVPLLMEELTKIQRKGPEENLNQKKHKTKLRFKTTVKLKPNQTKKKP